MQIDTAPLPGYQSAGAICGRAAAAYAPPPDVSVSECAAAHRRLDNPGVYVGRWDNSLAPWLVEPMDMFSHRGVREVHLVGPSQISGKSEMLLNVIGWAIKIAPADVIYMQPSVDLARDFADRRISNKFLGQSPDYGRLLSRTREGNKTFIKSFKTGALLMVVWPSPAQVSSRTAGIVLVDERDRMPDDLRGEGDPVALVRNRNRMYGRRRKLGNASSPSKEDGSGIMSNYYEGDRRVFTVDCQHCGDPFAPGFDGDRKPTLAHLVFEDTDKERAAATAGLKCPDCGAVHDSHDRVAMNRTGRWVPEGGDPRAAAHPPPPSGIVSYWLHGIVSTFVELAELAANNVEAEKHFARTGEETKLRTHYNTDLGIPYVSKIDSQAPLLKDQVNARAADYDLATVPPAVRFLTAAVDVQKNRFEVIVKGWDAEYESWLVDRFRIAETESGQPIDPGGHPEHWLELIPRVLRKVYDIAGSADGETLPVAMTCIDTGGIEGVLDNARSLWRAARKASFSPDQIRLIKGSSTASAPALPVRPTAEKDSDGKELPDGAPLYMLGVNTLKDTITNRFKRQEDGPAAMHTPHDTPDYYADEMTAERRHRGVWIKEGANESFDLEVYALAAAKMIRPERYDWTKPPWFADRKPNSAATAAAAPPPRRPSPWGR